MSNAPLTSDTPIIPGLETATFHVGKVVFVRILDIIQNTNQDWMGNEFLVEYIGTAPVCLDYGQNWFLQPGDKFRTRKVNIDSALEWLEEKY